MKGEPPLPTVANPCSDDSYFDLMGNSWQEVAKPELGFDADDFAQNLGQTHREHCWELVETLDLPEGLNS